MKFIKKHKAYILGIYAFLLLVHFIFKDHLYPISIIFYAAPLILIIIFGLITALFYFKNRFIFFTLLLVSALLSFHWFSEYYILSITQKLPKDNASVLFWNVGKHNSRFPASIVIEKTKTQQIDILSFVEARKLFIKDQVTLHDALDNYEFKTLKGDMFIGVNGKIESVIYKQEENRFKYNHIIALIKDKRTSILVVDVYANPLYSKEKALNTIIKYAETHAIDIIVGDFNTPYESIHFQKFKKKYKSFHDYSNGHTATWPYGIPLLELDQIWMSSIHIRPITLKKYHTFFSDHKLLIAEYVRN